MIPERRPSTGLPPWVWRRRQSGTPRSSVGGISLSAVHQWHNETIWCSPVQDSIPFLLWFGSTRPSWFQRIPAPGNVHAFECVSRGAFWALEQAPSYQSILSYDPRRWRQQWQQIARVSILASGWPSVVWGKAAIPQLHPKAKVKYYQLSVNVPTAHDWLPAC